MRIVVMEGGQGRSDAEVQARRIADGVDHAWQARFSGGGIGAPVAAVAALSVFRATERTSVAELRNQILNLDADGCGRTLRRVWTRFAQARPDLITGCLNVRN